MDKKQTKKNFILWFFIVDTLRGGGAFRLFKTINYLLFIKINKFYSIYLI